MEEQNNSRPKLEFALENLRTERSANSRNLSAEGNGPEAKGPQFDQSAEASEKCGDTVPINDVEHLASSPHDIQKHAPEPDRSMIDNEDHIIAGGAVVVPEFGEAGADTSSVRFLDPPDEYDPIPAFMRERKYEQPVERKPVKNVLFGITGVVILGAASLYYIPDNSPLASIPASDRQAAATVSAMDLSKSSESDPRRIISDKAFQARLGDVGSSADKLELSKASSTLTALQKIRPQSSAEVRPNPQIEGNKQAQAKRSATLVTQAEGIKKPFELPIDEIPVEGADAALEQLEKSLGGTASPSGTPAGSVKIAQTAGTTKPVDTKLQALTDQVVRALTDLGTGGGDRGIPLDNSVDRLRTSLENLVLEAQSQGKSTANVELLIKEAIGDNPQNLPAALKNKDGSLDITSLLASVVNRSKGFGTGSSEDNTYLSLIESEGNQTAVDTAVVSKRYITVRRGDTLSSISFAAYGDSFYYPKIYRANRKVLRNPNQLDVGMQLLIP